MEKELKDKLIEVLKDLIRLDTFLENGISFKRGMIEDPIKALEDILFSDTIRDIRKDVDSDNIEEMQDEITSKSIIISSIKEKLIEQTTRVIELQDELTTTITNSIGLRERIKDLEDKIRGFEA